MSFLIGKGSVISKNLYVVKEMISVFSLLTLFGKVCL